MPLLNRLYRPIVIITLSRCSFAQFAFQNKMTHTYSPTKICARYPHRTYAQESNVEHGTDTTQSGVSSSSSSSNSDESDNAEELLHSKILEAALPFVRECGWTTDAIARGAESLGYSSMVHGMFDKGGTDLVNYFYSYCNSRLEKELQSLVEMQKDVPKKMRMTEFMRMAIEIRLRMNTHYIDSWAKALVLLASPTNFSSSFNNFGTLIDTIWYYAGDRSYDFNWYTKRALLAGIYKATELCMLQDNSEDFQDTWDFLDRRLNEVEVAKDCMKQARQRTEDVGTILEAGLVTVQNMCGLNMKSRR